MGRKKANKQVAFYEHKHTEHSTTRRYHANILQQRRTIQLEVDTVLHAADLDDDPPLRVLGPSENLFDDIPPEVIEHQLTGVRVVARSEGPDRKRYESTVAPLLSFKSHRQEYLDEEIRLEGRRGLASSPCPGCGSALPVYRCEDCAEGEIFCVRCILARHRRLPLHTIKHWNGSYFEATTLCELGLTVQLGHLPHEACNAPLRRKLVVIHTNGIHQVRVTFCRCPTSTEFRVQLLRYAWWPATTTDPQTCATREAMRLFHLLNLQGNLTPTDFYRSLEQLTDSRKLLKLPDRLSSFMNIVRQWRNIKSAKRQGKGHDPGGINGTKPGELAVICRSCPHPGINLPDKWEDAPASIAFIYTLFLCMDANFRQKNRYRATTYDDVPLSDGWAYFVEKKGYMEHVSKFSNQEEMSTCAGFQAIHLANLKKMKGLSASGVVGVICARHEMWRPQGLGSLQRGERYCNMDYIFLSAVIGITWLTIVASYDIACQFFKNFWSRILELPPHLRLQIPQSKLIPKIPKAHIEAHGKDCHAVYSFNYMRGAGRTDGEGIERAWSNLNGSAPANKEMTPNARQETMDDHCGFSNWRKCVNTGNSHLGRMLESLKEYRVLIDEFMALDASLRIERPTEVAEWLTDIVKWENTLPLSTPTPYDLPEHGLTLNQVKLQLAREEEARVHMTSADDSSEATLSGFVLLALEIEDAQRALKSDIKNESQLNILQEKQLIEKRTAIRKKVVRYQKLLPVHLPLYTRRFPSCLDSSTLDSQHPENFPLILPSTLPQDIRLATCSLALVDVEERLREAQAFEALEEVRRYLRQRSFASSFKIKNITGQRANTRARQWLNTINTKVVAAKHTYRHARAALLALRGSGSWENTLRVLDDNDVRGLNERALTEQERAEREAIRERGGLVDEVHGVPVLSAVAIGDGRRTLSWIWSAPGSGDQSDSETTKALHVEWLKARARALRFLENIRLIYEEMRRAIETTTWIADNWENKAKTVGNVSTELKDGLLAYALEQAGAERALAAHWSAQWSVVRDLASGCLSLDEDQSSYFSNNDDEDIDIDDPDSTLRKEPVTIEITIERDTVHDEIE